MVPFAQVKDTGTELTFVLGQQEVDLHYQGQNSFKQSKYMYI